GSLVVNGGSFSTRALNSALGAKPTISLTNPAAGVALTVGLNNVSSTFGGVISGAGTLRKVGTGFLTLQGTNTLSGVTDVAAGSIFLDGTLPGTNPSLPGAVNLSAAGAGLNLAASNGLTGQFYNAAPNQANFVSVSALDTHLAGLTPAVV